MLGGAGLIVEPDDDAGIAAAMRTVLDDPEQRRRMTAAGLLRARAYSWDSAARTLYDVYAAAVARRNVA